MSFNDATQRLQESSESAADVSHTDKLRAGFGAATNVSMPSDVKRKQTACDFVPCEEGERPRTALAVVEKSSPPCSAIVDGNNPASAVTSAAEPAGLPLPEAAAPKDDATRAPSSERKAGGKTCGVALSQSVSPSCSVVHPGSVEGSATTRIRTTVLVPTLFTTAAGRPICVREARDLSADSPYWDVLAFAPEREAALSVEPQSDASIHTTARRREEAEAAVSSRQPLLSSRLGEEWFRKRPRREASCPERCHAETAESCDAMGESHFTLPPFTGFCTAKGQAIFLRPTKFQ